MSDFLTNLVSRSLDPNPTVQPRPASLYEPLPAADKMMAGNLFDPSDADQGVGDNLVSSSASARRQRQPVSTAPVTAQPSSTPPSYQSNELPKTPPLSYRAEDVFPASESAPDKSESRKTETGQSRERSSADLAAPQWPRSVPVMPAEMTHSSHEENSADLDSAQPPASESMNDKQAANFEYEIPKDLRMLLEGLVDETTQKRHEADTTARPPVPASQISISPASVTEEASQTAANQVVRAVTMQRNESAREFPEQFVQVEGESLIDQSVRGTVSVEDRRLRDARPPVNPETTFAPQQIRISPARESRSRFVSTEDASLTTSAPEMAAGEETKSHARAPAAHPITNDRIIPVGDGSPHFVSARSASLAAESVRETASSLESMIKGSGPAVRPVNIERANPPAESSSPDSSFSRESPAPQELSSSRTTVPTPAPTTIVIRPEISQARVTAEMRVDSAQPDTNVHVTIGRIEVRAIKAAEVQPKSDRAAQSTLMSLDDYLRRRAQGGNR
jgi:hypothetical protein